MKNYIGNNYIKKIRKIFKKIFNNNFSLLLWWWLWYESKKYYKYNKNIEDIDLFLVIDNINTLKTIDYNIFYSIWFIIEDFLDNLNIDIDLFNNNEISVIRINWKIDWIKCSINISSYDKLFEIFNKWCKINKIAHTKTYCMFKSHWINWENIMVWMFPIDISYKYNDWKKHYLISDFSYINLWNEYYLWLFTDFIAKWRIIIDNNNWLLKIQEKILSFILKNTYIKDIKNLLKIFASNELFSINFSNNLIKKLENVKFKYNIIKFNENNYYKNKIFWNYITIFPDNIEKYLNYNLEFNNNFNNKNIQNLSDFLKSGIDKKNYDFYLLYIELYKYSSLLNNFIFKENFCYNDVSIKNTIINENFDYNYLKFDFYNYFNIIDLFIESINKDLLDSENLKSIYLRIDIVLFILKIKKINFYDFISKLDNYLKLIFIKRSFLLNYINFLDEKLFEIIWKRFDIISTIDHIFSSPPLRLIDSYNKLINEKICLFLYDINLWNIKKYRRELVLDSVFYMENNKDFYVFNPYDYPYNCKINKNWLDIQKKNLEIIISKIFFNDKNKINLIIKRFDNIKKIFENIEKVNSSEYYKEYLWKLLNLLWFNDLSNFINNNMISFYYSWFIQKFIPIIIENTDFSIFSLDLLIKKSDFFNNDTIFYSKNKIFYWKNFIKEKNEIIEWLRKWNILPTSKIIVWSISVINLKHFWNDYWNFQKLDDFYKKLWIENSIYKLQITKNKEDWLDFLNFSNETYSYNFSKDKSKIYKNKTKKTRSLNMLSWYIHLWYSIKKYYNEYINTKEIKDIEFWNII